MTAKTNIGVTLGVVVGLPATHDEAGFDALTFIDAGIVTQLPDVGGSADVSSYDPMSDGVRKKLPGVIDYGSGTITFVHDESDAGLILLNGAFDGANQGADVSFSLTDSAGDVVWFTSKVFSFVKVYGSTGDVIGATVNIEMDSKIVASA